MLTILNTSILTQFGNYEYVPATLEEICKLIYEYPMALQSAIGHQATADILNELLWNAMPQGPTIQVNRINYVQQLDDIAIIFKLRGRAPEGVILDRAQVEAVGYDFGILRKLS